MAGFTIPNNADAAYPTQSGVDSGDLAIVLAGMAGTGVISGCAVTPSALLVIAIAAGVISVAGVQVSVAGTTKTHNVADVTNPRIDLVVVNSSGTVSITAGTAAAAPVYPAIPASSVVLAAVYIPALLATVISGDITDKRVFITPRFTTVFPLVACQINRSSIGDTYTDTVGNTFAETTHQTRITLGARTRLVTMKVSGHVSAGTGSFRLYNFTDSAALGSTQTTSSTTEVSLAVTTSQLDTNQGDAITIQVANNTALATVTIDSGGMMDSDDKGVFSATGAVAANASNWDGPATIISYVFLEALSTSTFTAQLNSFAGSTGVAPGTANFRSVIANVDSARSTFGTVYSVTPINGVHINSTVVVVTGVSPTLYLNVTAAANLTNNAQIGVAYQLSAVTNP